MTHQKFWSLAQHFIYDILHFDGKFFHTVLYLFTRPGFVARQYAEGKRMRYLDPIRMYLFTSAFFFLIFFSFSNFKIGKENASRDLSREDRQELAEEYGARMRKNPADTFLKQRIALLQDSTQPVNVDSLGWREKMISFDDRDYTSVQEYDSLQTTLPAVEKDGWFKRRLMRQAIKVNNKYKGEEVFNVYIETFLHKLPYLLFISLPFFAFILKLLYRRRKNFYYSDHAVFTLYHYILSFILILLIFGLSRLQEWSGWKFFGFLFTLVYLSWPVYLLIEMKNFYRQGWRKTVGKFLLLNIGGLLILIILFLIFLVFSIFQL